MSPVAGGEVTLFLLRVGQACPCACRGDAGMLIVALLKVTAYAVYLCGDSYS